MARQLSCALYPAVMEKLSSLGPQAYQVIGTIRQAIFGVRGVNVYTDTWPAFTTVLAHFTMPSFPDDSHAVFTMDLDKCKKLFEMVEWDQKQQVGGMLPEVAHLFRRIREGKDRACTMKLSGPYRMMHLSSTKCTSFSKRLSLPAGYQFADLQHQDAHVITSHWRYSQNGSDEFVRYLIANFLTVGVKDKTGCLVGWCLQEPCGALGRMHVLDTHRRLGLAEYATTKLTQEVLSRGQRPYVHVREGNVAAVKSIEKCGYTMTNDEGYIWAVPLRQIDQPSGRYDNSKWI